MIEAKIVADSVGPFKNRITSIICRFPRIVLAEINTHRMFSRNSASSRAIPTERILKLVQDDPFVPVAWQKEHKGMQGTEYFTDELTEGFQWKIGEHQASIVDSFESAWLKGRDMAISEVKYLISKGCTKQIANRLLEPFMYHTALITATEWKNFIKLRSSIYRFRSNIYRSRKDVMDAMRTIDDGAVMLSKIEKATILDWLKMNEGQAEIHLMLLVEAIWDAMNESTPTILEPGEWHIPFGDTIDFRKIDRNTSMGKAIYEQYHGKEDMLKVKIATARCARVSYINYEGKDDYIADLELYRKLSSSGHYSPFEHCAQTMTKDQYDEYTHTVPYIQGNKIVGCDVESGWCKNFRGFISHRVTVEK